MSASMGADFLMISRESALFSSSCKLMKLRVVPCRAMVKASVPQAPWGMPWFVAPQGISEGDRMFKGIDFYTLS
jgi:hypothetical protein